MSATLPRSWSVGVVIPAQNEELTIERCIQSVRDAHAACGRIAQLWIVVVADTCTDATVALARRALGCDGEVIECSPRSPGTARRLGVAAAMERFAGVAPGNVWLANTDADTRVPADWLRLHLDYADDDADAVAGIVHLDAEEGLEPVVRLHLASYELRNDGTHGHVHGANLGVRADAYLDVGGWSSLSVAEDHCLWHRLQRGGWRLCSSVSSVVITSARLQGRAIGGFADTLRHRLEAEHG